MKHFTHLIFSGHALKSIVLCGVLRYIYFHKLDTNIHDISATSMGAIFAFAFALKIPIDRLEKMISDLSNNEKIIKIYPTSVINIINNYGLQCSVEYLEGFRDYIKEVYNQDDITFLELSKKTGVNLYVSATRVDNGANVIFNVNDTPNISVFKAVGASTCIPLLSEPILIDGYYYIDGFLTNNFPCEVFSNIKKENILAIVNNIYESYKMKEKEKNEEFSILEYCWNIMYIYHRNTNKLCFSNKMEQFPDVLMIEPLNIKTIFTYEHENKCLNCALSEDELNYLYLIGYKSIHNYMNNHSNNNLDLDLGLISSNFQDI